MSSLDFYLACILGGSLSTGLTHAGVTPLDFLKCNMQANPSKHMSMGHLLRRVVRRYGAGALFRGWVPTLLGYSLQGAVKFGLYEFFKVACSDMARSGEGHEGLVCVVGSAWSEFVSDIFLCPFEAVKVRVQTHPDFGMDFPQATLDIVRGQGFKGLYHGLLPLWGRQIPFAIDNDQTTNDNVVKFACFEKTLEGIYKHILSAPKEECSRGVQLGVSFLAGYVSGVACAVVSQPADNLVSLMNNCESDSLSCALQKMGLFSLCTNGLWLRIVMVGTMSGAQWALYDAFKVINRKESVGKPTCGTEGKRTDFLQEGSSRA